MQPAEQACADEAHEQHAQSQSQRIRRRAQVEGAGTADQEIGDDQIDEAPDDR